MNIKLNQYRDTVFEQDFEYGVNGSFLVECVNEALVLIVNDKEYIFLDSIINEKGVKANIIDMPGCIRLCLDIENKGTTIPGIKSTKKKQTRKKKSLF